MGAKNWKSASKGGVAALAASLILVGAALAQDGGSCSLQSFEGAKFTVCTYEPGRDELRLAWKGRDGRPLAGLGRLQEELGADSRWVAFAMNAGMFESDSTPLGLYTEQGRVLRPINLREGDGNFYLKPNGVFWADRSGRVRIDEAAAFSEKQNDAVWATQSGPLLLFGSKLHPKISNDGESRLARNGVCLSASDHASFVIADTPVSFGKLARFFRDALGCTDGLYFDGAISSLWAPELGRRDKGARLGPILVVLKKRPGR